MKRFHCPSCGADVHFDNTACVQCGAAKDGSASFSRCANAEPAHCNWLVEEDAPDHLCEACRHNRTIPDLTQSANAARWMELERGKRGLFYSLMRWQMPLPTANDPDATEPLIFDFLADSVGADGKVTPVLTGHDLGVITLNIAEGDDAERERRRTSMGEPYRTILGHFRHEIGHYYWDLLVRDGGRLEACRALFGDEREDYSQALQRHYKNGAPSDWQERFISEYASCHPWEDFAETFAHYVHMVDTLETAWAYDLSVRTPTKMRGHHSEVDDNPYTTGSMKDLLAAFVPVTIAVNAMNRSMGQPDLYPFVLNTKVEEKLGFMHEMIRACATNAEQARPKRRLLRRVR